MHPKDTGAGSQNPSIGTRLQGQLTLEFQNLWDPLLQPTSAFVLLLPQAGFLCSSTSSWAITSCSPDSQRCTGFSFSVIVPRFLEGKISWFGLGQSWVKHLPPANVATLSHILTLTNQPDGAGKGRPHCTRRTTL